jgi:hypothetical protein
MRVFFINKSEKGQEQQEVRRGAILWKENPINLML